MEHSGTFNVSMVVFASMTNCNAGFDDVIIDYVMGKVKATAFVHLRPYQSPPATCHPGLQGHQIPPSLHLVPLIVPPTPEALQIMQSAADVSLSNLKTAQGMVLAILIDSSANINRFSAATNCVELLDNSYNRAALAVEPIRLMTSSKDSLACLSASLLYQYNCWSALKYANDTSMTNQTMSFPSNLMILSSNALAMVLSLDAFGPDVY